MLKNYLLIAFRNLMRNKTISLIHITGFGLGIAAFLFAAQTMIFEYSFDTFHKNGNRIFEIIATYSSKKGEYSRYTRIDPAIAHRLKGTVPEIQFIARYSTQALEEPYCVVTYINLAGEQKIFNESNAYYVDEDFLNIFEFPLVSGSRAGALSGTTSLVMTRSAARKYFGDEDALGKVVELTTGGTESNRTHFTYQISAVLEDLPANSSLQFDVLLPFRNFEENYKQTLADQWQWWRSYHNFILLKDPVSDPHDVAEKINKQFPEVARKYYESAGLTVQYHLQPIDKVHFDPDEAKLIHGKLRTSNKTYVLLVGLIGLVILIIAGINYINLTTAKALKRAKEVGIRKVSGADRFQLIKQFALDAMLINTLGLLFALTILQFVKPFLVVWMGLGNPQIDWWNIHALIFLLILIGCTLTSGIIPAILLTRVQPVMALKGRIMRSASGGLMRKALVVFQFGVSVALAIFTFTVFIQLAHMRSKETGFQTEQRLAIRVQGTEDFDLKKYRTFRERILTNPMIINATASLGIPGRVRATGSNFDQPLQPGENVYLGLAFIDYNYASTLGIDIIAGREFTEDRATDERVALLNETAVKELGFLSPEDAIGKTLVWHWLEDARALKIIGVIADFHRQSPREPIRNLVYFFANNAHPYPKYTYYMVHLAPGQVPEALNFLEKEWKGIFANAPFEYVFLDEAFQVVFQQEEKMQSLAISSMLLAILIACMGLGGLVAYSVTQRTKEIGIRKTLGASVGRILYLLSSDFIKLIFIAIVIAIPMVWYGVNEFLKNYEYRIQLSVWIFLIPCLLLLVIAIVTMGYQTMKAASSNPVEALKYE